MKTKILLSAIALCTGIFNVHSQATVASATNTIASGNYLGSGNNFDVVFKRNNVAAGVIATGSLSLGINTPTTVGESVIIGPGAGRYAGSPAHPRNVYVGISAGSGASTSTNIGVSNTFVGHNSGQNILDGNRNVFLGTFSGYGVGNGDENIYLGYSAGTENAGNNNVYVGTFSGSSAVTANGNVFLGNYSGAYETGSNLLYIENTDSSTPLI
jgi:hypothetical protein